MAFGAGIKSKLCDIGWRLGFGLVAGLCFVIAFVLLLLTAWLVLAEWRGMVFASWSLALFMLIVGFIVLAIAMRQSSVASEQKRLLRQQQLYDDHAAQLLAQQGQGRPGQMQDLESAMQLLLNELGVPAPARAGFSSLAAAAIYGVTLGVHYKRNAQQKKKK